jgi:hypothetical protein
MYRKPRKRRLKEKIEEGGTDSDTERKASHRKGGSKIRGRTSVHSALLEFE